MLVIKTGSSASGLWTPSNLQARNYTMIMQLLCNVNAIIQ